MSRTCLVSSTSISNSNANPHRVAILWPCLPDLGGPFCVGPVHLHFIETWGGGYCRDFQPKPSPQISIKYRCAGLTQEGPSGQAGMAKKGPSCAVPCKEPKEGRKRRNPVEKNSELAADSLRSSGPPQVSPHRGRSELLKKGRLARENRCS